MLQMVSERWKRRLAVLLTILSGGVVAFWYHPKTLVIPSDIISVAAILDEVPLYSKGDQIEIYGANLRQAKSGPIRITESILEVEQGRAVLAWWPRHSMLDQPTHVRVKLSQRDLVDQGALQVFVRLKDDTVLKFAARLGDRTTAATEPGPSKLPADLAGMLEQRIPTETMARVDDAFVGELSEETRRRVSSLGDDPVKLVALAVEGAAGLRLGLSEVSFARSPVNRTGKIKLAGRVLSDSHVAGASVELVDLSGAVRKVKISESNSFVFADLEKGQPVSLKVSFGDQDYFADQGRWIIPKDDMKAVIHVEPSYVNRDGHAPDPTAREFAFGGPAAGGALYSSHHRLRWNGNVKIQEFDSFTFTNNWGYVDRDRFLANTDDCYRVVHVGSSHAVAIQVPVAQKYNLLLEEDLGLRLNRCVEVISAGRDNGDPAANYPTIVGYAVPFKPDVIILDIQTALLMQLDGELSRRYLGWDPDHSGIGRLEYQSDGRLAYRPPNPNYALYTQPPDPTYSYLARVDLRSTLKVAWDKLPPIGQRTYRRLEDVIKFYREMFPGVRFVLESGVELAQCASFNQTCSDQDIVGSDGTAFKVGPMSFFANLRRACRDAAIECFEFPRYRYETDVNKPLVFAGDGHLNVRGHQWFARELAAQISEKLLDAKP
jgi:hypothetical protein